MNVSVFATNPSFVVPVLTELRKHHTVEIYEHMSGSDWFNIQNVRSLLEWCDVAFFDFCHYPLPAVTHMKLLPCKIVARLHGQELYADAANIRWSSIDHLIMSMPMKRKFDKVVNDHPKTTILPIGVDTDTFYMPYNKVYGKNICTHASSIYWKKRVYTTIQMFYELLLRDDEWKLYIKGSKEANWLGVMQRRYYRNVTELVEELGIQNQVRFSENVGHEEWAKWLLDKDVYVSNSIEEGFHVSLAEAMSAGVYPVINCWLGASDYYSKEYICRTQGEMVQKITNWSKLSKTEKDAQSMKCRKSVIKYDSKGIAKCIRRAIETVVVS